jgi:hypothetical protein
MWTCAVHTVGAGATRRGDMASAAHKLDIIFENHYNVRYNDFRYLRLHNDDDLPDLAAVFRLDRIVVYP